MGKTKVGVRMDSGAAPCGHARMIGIAGVGTGVGVTHFSIMTANYLAGYRRRKAALLEWNHSGSFGTMERVCTGMCREKKPYRVLDADYFKEASDEEMAEAAGRGYEDILLDFGDIRAGGLTLFLRCERQFLIGSLSEWQQEAYREFELQRIGTGKKSWISLTSFGSEEARKELWRRAGIFAERIPFSADAFSVTEETRDFLERYL